MLSLEVDSMKLAADIRTLDSPRTLTADGDYEAAKAQLEQLVGEGEQR